MRLILFISLFTLLVTFAGHSNADSADIVLTNAKVYSLDWGEPNSAGKPSEDAPFENGKWFPDADTVAIQGGKILFVGKRDDDGLADLLSETTELIDLNGATVIPGLVDSHVHIAELGEILQRLDLSNATSPDQALKKVAQLTDTLEPGEWLIGQGWDEGAWANNYPNRHDLDILFPNNPVFLKSLHGFGVWVNTEALKFAEIDDQTQPPVGGEIVRDKKGAPTGILLNRATTLFDDVVPKPSLEKFAESMNIGMKQLVRDGFVAAHQAGATRMHIEGLQQLKANDTLPMRIYAMLSARDKSLSKQWAKQGPYTDPDGFLDIRSAKAYYDGALGSRGARLLADYSDRKGHRGISGDGYGFDADVVDELVRAGFQVGIHAIGDAGNKEVLDYFTSANSRYPGSLDLRHRIEHAQVIQPSDFERFKSLKLIASMEPPHAVEDKPWAEARLGSERVKGAYAWRTLRRHNVPITFNSDLPGSDHSIFYGLHAAVTRRDKKAEPSNGWYPEQNMSIEEAIRAYTSWAAYSAFRDGQTGMLKSGYWADLTVMDINPFELSETEPEKILNGKIKMTIIDGKVVYQQGVSNPD